MIMHHSTIHKLLLCIGIALLNACASAPSQPLSQIPPQTQVWPDPPATARIAYVMDFSQPEDLGFTRGFFRKISDFFTGESEAKLIRPMAIIVDAKNNIYVADPGAKGVHRFSYQHGKHDIIRLKDNKPLLSPVALARGPADKIYISDSSLKQIFVADAGSEFAEPLTLSAELQQPTGIAFDPQRQELIVADTTAHKIKIFNHKGDLLNSFGGRGDSDAQFNYPTLIWRDSNGHLLVTDSLNFRIQEFDPQYHFIRQFGQHGDATGYLARPKGIATDKTGHIYIVDGLFHALQVFDHSGNLLLYIGGQGSQSGKFWLPTGIYIGENDTIYVADSHNHRIQVFRYIGGGP